MMLPIRIISRIAVISMMISVTNSPALDIVKDGTAAADIILPNHASGVVEYAAKELQSHVEAATGARLPILRESDERTPRASIYLGPAAAADVAGLDLAALPANGFRIVTTEDALYLAGKDGDGDPLEKDSIPMGTLFAVYRWLDEQLGVRWLWPGAHGTVIPRTPTVSLAPGQQTVNPWSIHSRLRNFVKVEDMPAKAEVNAWMLRQSMARPVDLDYGHAYGKYWEEFGKEHPEYFALRPDGQRGPLDKRTNLVQMCVSNPGLHAQIIRDWQRKKEVEPRRPWVNGIENDRRNEDPFCGCEACLAWDGPEDAGAAKSYSDRYARFWLSLQDAARGFTADPKVIGYAYSDYAKAPRQTRLNPGIVVGVVPSLRYPVDAETRKNFRQTWTEWNGTGASLFLRPNYFLYGYAMPYIYARQFGEDFKFAKDHGMIGTDFDSLTGMWGVQGPNLYMLGRLHARPDLKVEAVLEEYYSGFGPAKDAVREYFDYWEEVTRGFDSDFGSRNGGGWGMVSKAGDLVYTPEALAKGRAILDKAAEAAAGEPEAAARVRYLQVWLRHAELCMDTLRAFHAMQQGGSDTSLNRKFGEARVALDKFRKDHPEEFSTANMGILRKLETWSGWRSPR